MELYTRRLILRFWEEQDAPALYRQAKDPDIGYPAGWPAHKSIRDSVYVIRNVLSGAECYAVCLKEDDVPIGAIELKLHGHSNMTGVENECEVGYWIGKDYWGQGYIPEAAEELLRRAFEELSMVAVWCGYYVGNSNSKRVQEKLGFSYHHTCEKVFVPLLDVVRAEHINCMTVEMWRNRCCE